MHPAQKGKGNESRDDTLLGKAASPPGKPSEQGDASQLPRYENQLRSFSLNNYFKKLITKKVALSNKGYSSHYLRIKQNVQDFHRENSLSLFFSFINQIVSLILYPNHSFPFLLSSHYFPHLPSAPLQALKIY